MIAVRPRCRKSGVVPPQTKKEPALSLVLSAFWNPISYFRLKRISEWTNLGTTPARETSGRLDAKSKTRQTKFKPTWIAKLNMKPVAKYALITLGAFTVLSPILYLLALTTAMKSHAVEDNLVSDSKRVQEAVQDYITKFDSAPTTLKDIVPEFIEAIPSFSEISQMDYHVSTDGKIWTLDLHSAHHGEPVIYRRTNGGLDSEDTARRIDTMNGCYVLKARLAGP